MKIGGLQIAPIGDNCERNIIVLNSILLAIKSDLRAIELLTLVSLDWQQIEKPCKQYLRKIFHKLLTKNAILDILDLCCLWNSLVQVPIKLKPFAYVYKGFLWLCVYAKEREARFMMSRFTLRLDQKSIKGHSRKEIDFITTCITVEIWNVMTRNTKGCVIKNLAKNYQNSQQRSQIERRCPVTRERCVKSNE